MNNPNSRLQTKLALFPAPAPCASAWLDWWIAQIVPTIINTGAMLQRLAKSILARIALITTATDKKTRFYHASCVPRVFLLWHDTKRSKSRWNAWAVPMEGFSAWFHRLWSKMPGSVWGNQWISPNDRFYCPLTIIWRFIFSASTVTPPTQRALVTRCKAIMVAF